MSGVGGVGVERCLLTRSSFSGRRFYSSVFSSFQYHFRLPSISYVFFTRVSRLLSTLVTSFVNCFVLLHPCRDFFDIEVQVLSSSSFFFVVFFFCFNILVFLLIGDDCSIYCLQSLLFSSFYFSFISFSITLISFFTIYTFCPFPLGCIYINFRVSCL